MEIYSITKSLVALAIFHLLEQRKIPSLQVPMHTYFPCWDTGDHAQITLAHLMTHCSGLEDDPTANDLMHTPDLLDLALSSPLTAPPGQIYRYNNRAMMPLSALVEKVSGQDLESYVATHIFAPLGIQHWGWGRDGTGRPKAYGGTQMRAEDLIVLGQFMLNKASPLLSQDLYDRMVTPVSKLFLGDCGYLWWSTATPPALHAKGYLGQWLSIFPTQNLVAVRQKKRGAGPLEEIDFFKDFPEWVSLVALKDPKEIAGLVLPQVG